jgi:hypothetical protein
MGKLRRTIKTESDLDAACNKLSVSAARLMIKQIATAWFRKEDGSLDIDKEIGSDELEIVTQVLTSRGIMPSSEGGIMPSIESTCEVFFHTIKYWWRGDKEINEDIKPRLEQEVEARAEICIKQGYREGELNYEDETHSYHGWWSISKD